MSDEHNIGPATGIICQHALRKERPVGLVLHHTDGSWDFICDDEDADHDSADDIAVICSHCAFEDFVEGLTPDDVKVGHEAERQTQTSKWVVRPMSEEAIEAFEDQSL